MKPNFDEQSEQQNTRSEEIFLMCVSRSMFSYEQQSEFMCEDCLECVI